MRILVLAAVVVAIALAVASPRPEPAPPLRLADGRLPNVLLLTIDTLRADHLGHVASGPSDLTPSLDALADGGTVFLAATTPAPTTRTATASLLTGAYRGTHGVYTNSWPLGSKVPVLAESLGRAGYRTAAFFGNGILASEYGFGRGFETYESFADYPGRGFSKDEVGVARAVEWLESSPAEPWFLWVHLMDPHGPYDSAPKSVRRGVARDDARPERVLEAVRRNTGLGVLPRYQAIPGVRRASVYRWRYRAEVRHSDAQAGKLLAALEDLDLAESTLVVLTADHGEGLGDHDYFFQHGWLADEGSIAIPLAMRLPRRIPAGARIESPVSLVDVAPTLLGGLGLPVPRAMEGRDLSRAIAGGRPEEVPDAPVFSAATLLSGISSVRLGRWKLVHTPGPLAAGVREDDPWEPYYEREESYRLYDVRADPGETKDLAERHPQRVARMRALLDEWERAQSLDTIQRARPEPVDERLRDMLQSLGYVD